MGTAIPNIGNSSPTCPFISSLFSVLQNTLMQHCITDNIDNSENKGTARGNTAYECQQCLTMDLLTDKSKVFKYV